MAEADEDAIWALFDNFHRAPDAEDGDGESDTESGIKSPNSPKTVKGPKGGKANKADEADKDDEECPCCKSVNVISEDGQSICRACSVVFSRLLDSSAEWRYGGGENGTFAADPTRCGAPTSELMPKSSNTSIIGGRYGSRDIQMMRNYQMWNSMPTNERGLYHVFDLMSVNASKYEITKKILEDAKFLYKKAREKRISRGAKKDGLIASCIYQMCKENNVPRTVSEVARMFNIRKGVLTRGISLLQSILKLKADCSGPEHFIARFGSKLNMNYDDIQKCKEFTSQIDGLSIVSEHAPTSVAAGTLYYYCIAAHIDTNKKKIAQACEVCEGTITKCYKKLNQSRTSIDEILNAVCS